MENKKTKILYIAGNGRSGSTILNVILGQLNGIFTGGEVRGIWDCGVIENRICGCGVPFRECSVWKPVFEEAFGGMLALDPAKVVYYRERWAQTKNLPMMALSQLKKRLLANPDIQEFLKILDKLYVAISHVTNCSVIVDASKWPTYGFLLGLLPSVELYTLHLVRDPRAVAFSWTRKKESAPGRPMPTYSPLRTTTYWLVWNPAIKYFWDRPDEHYMFLPYEQFVQSPRHTVSQIARFVGANDSSSPFLDEFTVNLAETHGVAGNETRFAAGPIKLRLDDEWKTKLSFGNRLFVSGVTWPLLFQYGYPLRVTG